MSRALIIGASAVICYGAPLGCVDRGGSEPRTWSSNPAGVAALPVPLVGRVGDVVAMRGTDPSDAVLNPGDEVRFSYGFVVEQAVPSTYQARLALIGAPGTTDYLAVFSPSLQVDAPPASWRPGDALVDPVAFHLPGDWSSPTATLVWWLAPGGSHEPSARLPVREGVAMDGALILGRWSVNLAARVPGGATPVPRATSVVVVDGKADEPAWASAAQATLVVGEQSPSPSGTAQAKLLWDDTSLYVYVYAADDDVNSPYVERDDPLWQADVIELFIDTDRNGRDYVELQASPAGVVFDAHFPGGRGDKSRPTWNSRVAVAVAVDGTLNDASDRDRGWSAEFAIPWGDVKVSSPPFSPAAGQKLALNVVRVDQVGGKPAVASWSRVSYRDFHGLDRLLQVVLIAP